MHRIRVGTCDHVKLWQTLWFTDASYCVDLSKVGDSDSHHHFVTHSAPMKAGTFSTTQHIIYSMQSDQAIISDMKVACIQWSRVLHHISIYIWQHFASCTTSLYGHIRISASCCS